MDPQGYKIIFEGKVAAGVDVDTAKSNLQRLFKASDATIERLFSGKRVILKRNVKPESIEKYVKALTRAGVLFRTDPAIETAPETIDFITADDAAPASNDAPATDDNDSRSEQEFTQTDNTDLTNVDLTVHSTTQFQANGDELPEGIKRALARDGRTVDDISPPVGESPVSVETASVDDGPPVGDAPAKSDELAAGDPAPVSVEPRTNGESSTSAETASVIDGPSVGDAPAQNDELAASDPAPVGVEPRVGSEPSANDELSLVNDTASTPDFSPVEAADKSADNPYAPPGGDPTISQRVFCRSCGNQIYESDVICPQCGARQLVGKPKSKVVAALLAVFLGFIGAHRFYLGQWLGILYIFFGVISWLVAIVEGVVFLLTPAERWERKYGNVVTSGGAAMVIVAVILFVGITGILAAVAIPAYVDYTQRAAVASAEAELEPTLQAVEDFARREGYLPNDNAEAGLPARISTDHIKSAVISANGVLLVVLEGEPDSPIAEQTLLWVPQMNGNKAVSWDCSGGTLPARVRTLNCREGKYSGQQSIASTRWVAADDGSSKILLPTGWQRMPELTEVAGIEYGNPYREQYAIVISEAKADFSDEMDLYTYNDIIIEQNFRAMVSDLNVKLIGEVQVNGMRGIKYELRGEVDRVKIVYLHIALEGRNHYHQVLFWTLPSKWRGNRKTFETALAKFTECPGGCQLD